MDRLRDLPEEGVGGAGDQGELAGLDRTQPDLSDEAVDTALGHRRAGPQAQLLGHLRAQATDGSAHVLDVLRVLLQEALEADGLQQADRKAALVAVVVVLRGRNADGCRPFAGQPVDQPVDGVADVPCFPPGLGLLLLEPQALGQSPLGRDGAETVVLQGRITGVRDALGLVGGAHVHPHDRRSQRAVIRVQGENRRPGGVHTDAGDGVACHAALLHGAVDGGHQTRPPDVGILLGPARTRVARLELDGMEHNRRPLDIKDAGPHPAGAIVDAHQVGTLGHALLLQADISQGFCVENRCTVISWYSSPGRSAVEGKFGWFGESGKCWVSRQKP